MKFIICIVSILFIQKVFSQSLEEFQKHPLNIQSPTVAGLEKFGDVPISYFTGRPSITVPIYNLSDGGIGLNLKMGYNAGGFQPDIHPGWVGQNWNLDVGGVISRSVNDHPDELIIPDVNAFQEQRELGFYYKYNFLNQSNWNTIAGINEINEFPQSKNFYDTEPDVFTFNFDGHHGKFFLDHLRNWQVQSDEYLKVEFSGIFTNVPILPTVGSLWSSPPGDPNPYRYPKTFEGFKVTTSNGTKYYFGFHANAIEYSMGLFAQYEDAFIANSWYLTKIEGVDGRVIDLTYDRGDYVTQLYSQINQTSTNNKGPGFLTPACVATTLLYPMWGNTYGNLISPVYLSAIESENQKIKFNRSETIELSYTQAMYDQQYTYWNHMRSQNPSNPINILRDKFLPFIQNLSGLPSTYPACLANLKWYQLNSVEVFDKINSLTSPLLSYSFNYVNNSTQRLTLGSIQEKGKGGIAKPPYIFTYNGLTALPPYLAHKNDHWGYFNNIFPIIDVNDFTTYKAFREPNSSVALYGILEKLTYPTGGSTVFEYEQHNYKKAVSTLRSDPLSEYVNSQTAGGLRIKKIKNFDYNNILIDSKDIYYVVGYNSSASLNSFNSSGVLSSQIQYYWDDYRYAISDNVPNLKLSKKIFSSTSLIPGGSSDGGSHIGYSEVAEVRTDGSYTIYKYTNFDNGYKDESFLATLQISQSPYEPFIDNARFRGKLLTKSHFTPNNKLIQQVANDYEVASFYNAVRAVKANASHVCSPTVAAILSQGTSYEFPLNPLLLIRSKETMYDPAITHYVSKIREFTYDNRLNIKSILTKGSDGSINEILRTFPYDILGAGTLTSTDEFLIGIKELNTKNITNAFIEEKILEAESENHSKKQVGGRLVKYKTSIPLIDEVYAFETSIPVYPVTNIGTVNNAGNLSITFSENYRKQVTHELYDAKGNIIEFKNNNEGPTSFLWNYNKRFPVVEVKNSNAENFGFTSFETNEKGGWLYTGDLEVSGDAVTGKRSFELATGLTITSKTIDPSRNYIVSYWSKSGQYTVTPSDEVKVGRAVAGWTYYEHRINLPATAIVVTGEGKIDELRLYPVGSQMTTRTYDPIIGMTSLCDENNVITYYEYDNFRRLITIRNEEKHILTKYCYNYAGEVDDCGSQKYYNSLQRVIYSRNNCGPGQYPVSFIYYTVDANTYASTISLKHVEQFVNADIAANGQTFANNMMGCTTTPPTTCPMSFPSGVTMGGPPFIIKYTNTALFGGVFTINSYSSGKIIAMIPPSCRPMTTHQSFPFWVGERKFQLQFETSGNVRLNLLEGPPLVGTNVIPVPQTIYYITAL